MSEQIHDGGPAFPLQHQTASGPYIDYGMTLRDYFATYAMTAIVSLDRTCKAETAETAYEMADAMLAARDKK